MRIGKKIFKNAIVLFIALMLFLTSAAVIADTNKDKKIFLLSSMENINEASSDSDRSEIYLSYDGDLNQNSIGLQSGGTFYGAIRLTPDELGEYDGENISKIRWHHQMAGELPADPPTNVVVYLRSQGTSSSPGSIIQQINVGEVSETGWLDVSLNEPYSIDGSQDLWCVVRVAHAADQFPLGVGQSPMLRGKGGWISTNGASWSEIYDVTDPPGQLDYNWNIGAIVLIPEPLEADASGPYEAFVGEDIQFSGMAYGGEEPYSFLWDFGDGTNSTEQNPIHNYSFIGEFIVNLTVTDNQGVFAEDNTTASILAVPEEPELDIVNISGGFGGISATIKNIGDAAAVNGSWNIEVEGGILGLIDVDVEGEFDEININEEIQTDKVSVGLLRFGNIEIEVSANAENANKVKLKANAFVFGPVVLNIEIED